MKAQFDETKFKFNKSIGTGMLIVDTTPTIEERMKKNPLNNLIKLSKDLKIDFWYFNQTEIIQELVKLNDNNPTQTPPMERRNNYPHLRR